MKKLTLIVFLAFTSAQAAEVVCETIQSSIKKIRCKYMALAQAQPRTVTFKWVSPDNPADNRSREHRILAGHVSVFDYRYFAGRAEGKWLITVIEKNHQSSVSTEFVKDSNKAVEIESTDPLLNGR